MLRSQPVPNKAELQPPRQRTNSLLLTPFLAWDQIAQAVNRFNTKIRLRCSTSCQQVRFGVNGFTLLASLLVPSPGKGCSSPMNTHIEAWTGLAELEMDIELSDNTFPGHLRTKYTAKFIVNDGTPNNHSGCDTAEGSEHSHDSSLNCDNIKDGVLDLSPNPLRLKAHGSEKNSHNPRKDGDNLSRTQTKKSCDETTRKRKWNGIAGTKDGLDHNSDEDDDLPGAETPSKKPSNEHKPHGFKCPFYQRRPEAHQRSSCKVKSYKTMARLK